MDNRLSIDSISFQNIIDSLPQNIWIHDSFTKAKSMIAKYDKILCSVSGGSDSDIIIDMLTRLDKYHKIDYIYFDTGMEYKATKEHLDYLENRYHISIKKVRPKYPVPLACKMVGEPFLSKQVSEFISRLQKHDFKWEDKPYDVLVKEYPNCISALQWWCNYKSTDGKSMFNISRNKWLKEYLIDNPPTFKISSQCCNLAKKKVSHEYDSQYGLKIIGVRKAEGGARAGHNTCITFGKQDTYRPIFWYRNTDKEEYEQYAEIKHSSCYTDYGLKRTGCAGCPFGRDFEYELDVLRKKEPNLYKAACNIFKNSYEYTRQYRAYAKQKNEEIKKSQSGYQTTIFDYIDQL